MTSASSCRTLSLSRNRSRPCLAYRYGKSKRPSFVSRRAEQTGLHHPITAELMISRHKRPTTLGETGKTGRNRYTHCLKLFKEWRKLQRMFKFGGVCSISHELFQSVNRLNKPATRITAARFLDFISLHEECLPMPRKRRQGPSTRMC